MALNPYFLQGSRGEQRLVQSLINEHLKIYGVEITFIPRKFVNRESIIEEVTASKFDDNFKSSGKTKQAKATVSNSIGIAIEGITGDWYSLSTNSWPNVIPQVRK